MSGPHHSPGLEGGRGRFGWQGLSGAILSRGRRENREKIKTSALSAISCSDVFPSSSVRRVRASRSCQPSSGVSEAVGKDLVRKKARSRLQGSIETRRPEREVPTIQTARSSPRRHGTRSDRADSRSSREFSSAPFIPFIRLYSGKGASGQASDSSMDGDSRSSCSSRRASANVDAISPEGTATTPRPIMRMKKVKIFPPTVTG